MQSLTVGSNDGSPFFLQTLFLKMNGVAANTDITLTGYRSGVAVPGATLLRTGLTPSTTAWFPFNVAGDPAFANVDQFVFTQAASTSNTLTAMVVDQITIATAQNLPLTLIDFSALKNGNTIQLNGSTASEQNTASFNIERSTNGNDYTTIGSVKAAANKTEIKTYSYSDVPFAGSWYYRLKMIDLDARFTYSPVLKIDAATTIQPFSAWPNPFNQQLTLTAEATEPSKARLTIRDMIGRLITKQDLNLQKGTNNFSLPTSLLTAKGIYLLNLVSPNGQQTIRVLKND